MDVCNAFIPEPLRTSSHIRLLEFQPFKQDDDAMTFRVVQTQLDDANAVDYVALSHAWGLDRELVEYVVCDGKKHPVTARLYSALQRIRTLAISREHWKYLWVDAICINQATNPEALQERASQVSIMSKIFGRAIEIVVDLGEATSQSAAMMEVDALKLASETDSETLLTCIAVMRGAFPFEMDISDYPITPYLEFCSNILGRDWFTRRWIVQEYVHARKIVFLVGHDASYDFLDTMANFFRMVPLALGLSLDILLNYNFLMLLNRLKTDFRARGRISWTFPALVAAHPPLQNFDPRDTIYSMLSLGDDATFDVTINYEEASYDLSRRYALQLLGNGYWEAMLHCAVSQNAHQLTDGPASSWGFSLNFTEFTYRLDDARMCLAPEQVLFCAGIPSQETGPHSVTPHVRWSPIRLCDHSSHTNCLCARVVLTEQLLDLSGLFPLNRDEIIHMNFDNDSVRNMSAATCTWLIECVQLLRRLPGHKTDTAASSSTFWYTFMHDTWLELHQVSKLKDEHHRLFTVWLEALTERGKIGSNSLLGTNGSLSDSNPLGSPDDDFAAFSDTVAKIEPIKRSLSNLWNRRLAISNAGHFCSVPGGAKAGDMVAVFKDTRMPFVVRRVGSEFELVGSCFVHGVMYGESLGHRRDSAWEEIHVV